MLSDIILENIIKILSEDEHGGFIIDTMMKASNDLNERLTNNAFFNPMIKQAYRIMSGHTDWVVCVAWSPDSKKIVSGSYDMTLRIWDAETGKQIGTPLRDSDYVTQVAWSPDSQQIVSGGYDNILKIWDTQTGKQIKKLKKHTDRVSCVAWSPDGKKIVSGSYDMTLRIWDAKTGKKIGKPLEGNTTVVKTQSDLVQSVAWSPDSQRIVSGGNDKTVRIWDAQTGKQIKILNGNNYVVGTHSIGQPHGGARASLPQGLSTHTDCVWSVAWSPDGQRIVSGSRDGTMLIWDAQTGNLIGYLVHTDSVNDVGWSPDSQRIVSECNDNRVYVWDTQTGEQIGKLLSGKTYADGPGILSCVAWRPDDGQRIVFGYDVTIQIYLL